jgi:hypothetical protein
MLLSKIESAISDYQRWLEQTKFHPVVHPWESVQHFQQHWNLDDAAPVAMFERCFQNSETRRLWQTENWYPKRMMGLFWQFDPMTVRLMFEDLFTETRGVEGRVGRFLFGCDTLLRDYKKAHPATIENNHYHDDYQMISLYLCFRYPDQYAPYAFPIFQRAMTRLGAVDIPQQNDLPRYFKVLATLMGFLDKNPAVAKAMQRHLHPKRHFQGKTLLLAGDFCRFIGER